MPTARSSPCPPTTSAAICPRASRSPTARPGSASRSCRTLYRQRGLRPRPSRRDAAREPARARAAQAGAATASACAACRSIRTTGRARPPTSSSTASPTSSLTLAAREGAVARGPGAERAPAAGGAVGAVRRPRCRRRRGRPPATAPSPETPASILYTSGTTGRPKGCILSHGYEVAVGRLVCLARRRGDAAPGPGAHLQSAAALSRQRRRRVADGRHPDRQLPDPARPLPSAALVARDRRDAAPPSCTISASSRRCC